MGPPFCWGQGKVRSERKGEESKESEEIESEKNMGRLRFFAVCETEEPLRQKSPSWARSLCDVFP